MFYSILFIELINRRLFLAELKFFKKLNLLPFHIFRTHSEFDHSTRPARVTSQIVSLPPPRDDVELRGGTGAEKTCVRTESDRFHHAQLETVVPSRRQQGTED